MEKIKISSRVEVNPKVAFGKPVIAGTRIAVEFILELLEAGWTFEQILKEYPKLTKKDVLACIGYARELVGEWKGYPLQSKINGGQKVATV